jgi:hypothetical protein
MNTARPLREIGSRRCEEDDGQEQAAPMGAITAIIMTLKSTVAYRGQLQLTAVFKTTQNPRFRRRGLGIFLGDSYHPDADIGLFLRAKFVDLRRRYRLPSTGPRSQSSPSSSSRPRVSSYTPRWLFVSSKTLIWAAQAHSGMADRRLAVKPTRRIGCIILPHPPQILYLP